MADECVRMSRHARELDELAAKAYEDARVFQEAAALMRRMAEVSAAGEDPKQTRKELKTKLKEWTK
jgi:hypothetical protein